MVVGWVGGEPARLPATDRTYRTVVLWLAASLPALILVLIFMGTLLSPHTFGNEGRNG
jgi:hypothetical protein